MKPRFKAKAQVLSVLLTSLLGRSALADPLDSVHAVQEANPPEIVHTVGEGSYRQIAPHEKPNRIVYGWFPTWVWKKVDGVWPPMPRMRWDLLTHVSFFSIPINASADLEQTSLLTGHIYTQLRDTAKANDVKITITVTNKGFDNDVIVAVVAPSLRTKAVNNIVAMAKNAGAEGVNIDFESVTSPARDNFTAFMVELTNKMHAEIPGSHVSLAGPTISYKDYYDYDKLLEGSDGIIPMFYGCAGSWSTKAGPAAPLTGGATWSSNCNMQWVTQDYLKWGKVENRRHVMMGLPFYGNRWDTESSNVGARVVGNHSSVTLSAGFSQMNAAPRWDSDSQTPWSAYSVANTPRQLWTEDAQSFDAKLEYLVSKDLGGIGIWALGYEGEDDSIWDVIQKHFVSATPPPPPANTAPVAVVDAELAGRVGQTLTLDGSSSNDAEGDALTFAWRQIDGPTAVLSATDAPVVSFTPTIAGKYRFWLTVSDAGRTSQPAETTVAVAVADPTTVVQSTEQEAVKPEPFQPGVAQNVATPQGCAASQDGSWLLVFAALILFRRR